MLFAIVNLSTATFDVDAGVSSRSLVFRSVSGSWVGWLESHKVNKLAWILVDRTPGASHGESIVGIISRFLRSRQLAASNHRNSRQSFASHWFLSNQGDSARASSLKGKAKKRWKRVIRLIRWQQQLTAAATPRASCDPAATRLLCAEDLWI